MTRSMTVIKQTKTNNSMKGKDVIKIDEQDIIHLLAKQRHSQTERLG